MDRTQPIPRPPRSVANLVVTGLRSGEMLHEELAAPSEESNPTVVSKVIIVRTSLDHDSPVLTLADRWTHLFDEGRGADGTCELKRSYKGLRNEDLVVEVGRNAAR